MKILNSRARNCILPDIDAIYDRSSTSSETVIIDPDHSELLHHFDNAILFDSQRQDLDTEILNKRGQTVGRRHVHDIMMQNEIDRSVYVYTPIDELRSDYSYSIVMDTPWYTGVDGHNDRVAELLMKHLGVSVVLVGPEFSSKAPADIGALQQLGRIAQKSLSISLMSAAEASAEIYRYLQTSYPEYCINKNVVDVGESRGAMAGEARHVYLRLTDMQPLGSEFTDPSASVKALRNTREVLSTLMWFPKEGLGALAVGAALAKSGDLYRQIGTVPTDLRFHIGAALGTGPAILGGEEGQFSRYTPLSHGQFIVNARNNSFAGTETRKENYKDHTNTSWAELNMHHLGLGYPSVVQRMVERLHALGVELNFQNEDIDRINWKKIHMTHKLNRVGHDLAA